MFDPARRQGKGAAYVQHDPTQVYQGDPGQESGAYQAGSPGVARRIVHVLGAVASLSLVGMGGYWFYQQTMRDLHGVPVVRALEGPARIAPDDPGGEVAANGGLAVNAVQAGGPPATIEERLVLAPKPTDLTDEDVAGAELVPDAPAPDTAAVAEEEAASLADAFATEPDDLDVATDEPGAEAAAVAEPPRKETQQEAIARALAMAALASEEGSPVLETEDDPVEVTRAVPFGATTATGNPRPAPRPGSDRPTGLPTTTIALATPATVDPSAVAPGTRLVQLGAFDSPQDAEAEWARIASRFDALMANKSQVVVEARAGGRSFWRLRAMGFDSLADARQFCAALVAERTDCIPVVAR